MKEMKLLFRARGFTLIELVIFIGIFTVSVIGLTTLLVVITGVQTKEAASSEVSSQSQFLLQQLQYYIENARIVDMTQDVTTSTLTLREFSSAQDPTSITLATGTIYVQQSASGTLNALTSNKVSVSQLSFTRHFNLNAASFAYGTDSVSFSFTMSSVSRGGTLYTQTYQSSAAVLVPVGKIAMIQQAKAENTNVSVSTLAATYGTNNETSSLLIAVVANQTSTSVPVPTDTAGNTWIRIVSSSYAGIDKQAVIFAAYNAKNSSNTVTATFGAGAGYASLYLYEYRGAATSSSFDASSTQTNSNTAMPSSGIANPTSTVELLLGADAGPSLGGATASAGNGFTLETSSTGSNVTQVFMEDADRYVTGPVSSSWQFLGAVSTTALLATFK